MLLLPVLDTRCGVGNVVAVGPPVTFVVLVIVVDIVGLVIDVVNIFCVAVESLLYVGTVLVLPVECTVLYVVDCTGFVVDFVASNVVLTDTCGVADVDGTGPVETNSKHACILSFSCTGL